MISIEQATFRSSRRVRMQRAFECRILDEDRKPGQRPLVLRCIRKAAERGPDQLLDLWRDLLALAGEQSYQPVCCPRPLGHALDPGKRLEGDALLSNGAAKIVP